MNVIAFLFNFICIVVAKRDATRGHPCGTPVQEACVREYLATRSACHAVVNGPNLDPSYLKGFPLEVPSFNLTEYIYDSKFVGLKQSHPVSLKVDNAANITILTVFHPKVILDGTITTFFYSEANAPIIVTSTFVNTYTDFTTTTMIPGTKSINIGAGQNFPFFKTPPTIVFGDNIKDEMAKNTLVNQVLTAALKDITTLSAEQGLAIFPRLVGSYINQNLCQCNKK